MNPAELLTLMPFAATLGIELELASKDPTVGRLPYDASLTTAGGALHGGALMTLADTVGAVCAYLNLPPGTTTSTTSSNTVFVRAVRSGAVTATARLLHVGRTTIAVSTELRDAEGVLVAHTTQSQAVLATG
jgi:uncharacterized protein (TIGR00369 family)